MSANLLGSGIGRIYCVEPNFPAPGTLVQQVANNQAGVRTMRDLGANVTPIAAERKPFSTITFTGIAAGATIQINVLGVPQLTNPGPYICTGVINDDVAAITTIINDSFTAAFWGDIQALADGNQLFLFGETDASPALNNQLPVLAVAGVITSIITPFINGARSSGAIDEFFGYRFILNPTPGATPNFAGATAPQAVEVTKYIVNRGLTTGMQNLNVEIDNDAIEEPAWERISALTQVFMVPEGGAFTDDLKFIDPRDFVFGDLLYLRVFEHKPFDEVVTVKSVVDPTLAGPRENIYLVGGVDYQLTGGLVLVLQYKTDERNRPGWFEVSRSETNSTISISLLDFSNLVGGSSLTPNQLYYITDLLGGAYVNALSNTEYDVRATMIRRVPYNYAGCWRTNMTAPTIGLYYRYNQLVYQSVTGAIGTAPEFDPVNWLLVPQSDNNLYNSRFHKITLSTFGDLVTWPYIEECDNYGNIVRQTRDSGLSIGNSFDSFGWQYDPGGVGNIRIKNNVVTDSNFECANSDGFVKNNIVTNSLFLNNRLDFLSDISESTFNGMICTDNYLRTISKCSSYSFSQIVNNGSPLKSNINIVDCSGFFEIVNNTYTDSGSVTITVNGYQIEVASCVMNGTPVMNIVGNKVLVSNCNFNTGGINATMNNSIIQFASGNFIGNWDDSFATGDWVTCGGNFTSSNFGAPIGLPSATSFQGTAINSGFGNYTGSVGSGSTFINTGLGGSGFTPVIAVSDGVVTGGYGTSSMTYDIDLDDPAFYDGVDTLTIPYGHRLIGTFRLLGTGNKAISKINWQQATGAGINPMYLSKYRFINWSFGSMTITINTTPAGSYSSPNEILGSQATYSLDANITTNIPDIIEITDLPSGGVANYVYYYSGLI